MKPATQIVWAGIQMTAAPAVSLFDISEILSDAEKITIWTHEPHPCTCGRMTTIFVSRDGRSACAECDEGKR